MTSLARDLILECYHSPTSLQRLVDGLVPFPDGVERVLQDAVEAWQQNAQFEETATREMRYALLHFAKNVMFLEEGDYYRALALQPDARQERVEQHYRWWLILLQSDTRDSTLNLCQHVIRISRAVAMLGDTGQRRLYDRSLYGPLATEHIDINVSDVTESLLGTPLHGTRARPTVDAEFTVELETEPKTGTEDNGVGVRPEHSRAGVIRVGTGLVLAAVAVLATLPFTMTLMTRDDQPPQVIVLNVDSPLVPENTVDAFIPERSDIDLAPVAEPASDWVEYVSDSMRYPASALPGMLTADLLPEDSLSISGTDSLSPLPLELATHVVISPSAGIEDASR